MPENRKLSQIQLVEEVFDIQGKSLENQNTAQGAMSDKYDWVGTIEEYQEQRVAENHPEWVCYIVNDIHGGDGALDLVDFLKKVDYNEDQEDVVHKSTNETITGTKSFTENDSQVSIITKAKIVDDTQNPISTQLTNFIDNHDKNDVLLSRIYTDKKSDGSNGIYLQAWKGNTNYNIGVDSNGHSYAPMPGATSSDAATDIALTGWVNDPTKSTNVVHKSGDEEISGYKTFISGGHTLRIRRGTGSLNWTDIRTEDTNGVRTGGFRNIIDGSNNNETNMYVTSSDGSTILGAISVSTDGTNAWAKAPESDVLGSIVVNSAISKTRNGYVKLGNGIIIQWGNHNRGTSNTVNLPTAFTSTDYSVVFSGEGNNRYSWSTSKTTTTFTFNSADDATTNNDGVAQWIAVGY